MTRRRPPSRATGAQPTAALPGGYLGSSSERRRGGGREEVAQRDWRIGGCGGSAACRSAEPVGGVGQRRKRPVDLVKVRGGGVAQPGVAAEPPKRNSYGCW